MITLRESVCIEAPAATVWATLARLEDIQLWSEAVVDARCDGPISRGVGAERICELMGHRTIREQWVAWDEGRSFAYEGFGIPMMKRATNRWTVLPYGERALLMSEAEVEVKGGLLGRILELLISPLLRRIAPRTLAGFKYLVEHGQPYPGKAAELPCAPAGC